MPNIKPKEFIDSEYPFLVRSQFIPIIQAGIHVANSIFEEHAEFYYGSMASNIRGRLFSYAIMLQFSPDLGVFNKAQYEICTKKVNSFGYTIPEIIGSNSVLHIVKSISRNQLPTSSKYKVEYAKNNDEFDSGQMKFDIDFESVVKGVSVEKKYILLLFGSKNNKTIDFAQLVLPNSNFTNILDEGVDLFTELHVIKDSGELNNKIREKELVALKQSVIDKIKLDIADIEP